MILTPEQITSIIKFNPNKDLIKAGKDYNKKMRMHFYGDMKEDSLPVIDGFEKPTLRSLRVKYTKSNKDLMNRIARPIDKVFSARGGSVYYNLPETEDKRVRGMQMDIKSGYSIKGWLENFWKAHYLDDPYGLLFMEIADERAALRLMANGQSVMYPTYKSIQCVYDYLPNGSSLEYVIFTVDNKEKIAIGIDPKDIIYRVVDDAFDYYVKWESDIATILPNFSYPNLSMKVPAIINSDIPDPNRDGGKLSFFDEILELADNFLLKGSIKLTHDFMHAFPKYWEYADNCNDCGGTTFKGGETCTTCKGTGKSVMTKVSDIKLLNYPQDKDAPIVTPGVAGYVEPSVIFHQIATEGLQMLEDLMTYTLWGASLHQQTQGMSTTGTASGGTAAKTATEIMNDIKPQSDRLTPISESAEKRHKFILDNVIEININQSYRGSSVNYGKRYMIESPDTLWEKYSDARARGAAYSVLDDLLLEYYEAKYNSDPIKLAIQTKLMKVEPFVHYTAGQLKPLSPTDEDYTAKLYFGEWLSTLNEAMILSFSTEELRLQLLAATKPKIIPMIPGTVNETIRATA